MFHINENISLWHSTLVTFVSLFVQVEGFRTLLPAVQHIHLNSVVSLLHWVSFTSVSLYKPWIEIWGVAALRASVFRALSQANVQSSLLQTLGSGLSPLMWPPFLWMTNRSSGSLLSDSEYRVALNGTLQALGFVLFLLHDNSSLNLSSDILFPVFWTLINIPLLLSSSTIQVSHDHAEINHRGSWIMLHLLYRLV